MTIATVFRACGLCLIFVICAGTAGAAERINQEGRILGATTAVTTPTLFDTAAADAIVSAMQIFPTTSAWNEDISNLPLITTPATSAAIIADIRNDLASNATRQRLVVFQEMNYVLVPDNQAIVDINFFNYPDQSDDLIPASPGNNPSTIGGWPIPTNLPIEAWPTGVSGETLSQVQTDALGLGGDRHSITVMPGAGYIWETWETQLTTQTPPWQASNGAKFPLTTNVARPDGWTSGDAAGLPMFPALVRYDEAERGMVEHCMRVVVKRSSKAHIYPATHDAGSTTDPTVPAMGQRIRLKASYVIPSTWTKEETAIALALKKYGALVADNGNFFSISICPDDRWSANAFNHLSTGAGSDYLDINNFEVVQSTGATQGPRSAGAPTANAGADQAVTLAAGASLAGAATGTGITTQWYAYPVGTTGATIANPASLTTTVQFAATGTYTVMLKVTDGTHAPAFDAVVITVAAGSNPVPTLTVIAPTSVAAGSAATLTLSGSNFVSTATVTIGSSLGSHTLSVATATATQLTVNVPATDLPAAGSFPVSVTNPGPGGGSSGSKTLTITPDITPPVITPGTVVVSSTSATVPWTTNEAATGAVNDGTSIAYTATAPAPTLALAQSVVLTNLTASTTYHYAITARDAAGNTATTSDATFMTLATGGTSTAGGTSTSTAGTSTADGTSTAGGTSSAGGTTAASAGGGGGGGGGCGMASGLSVILLLVGLRLRRRARS